MYQVTVGRSMHVENLYTIHTVMFCTAANPPVSLELAGICTHCTPFKCSDKSESKMDCIPYTSLNW